VLDTYKMHYRVAMHLCGIILY